MAFITPKELETHLYKENIEAVNREDETILTATIDATLQEAYGYLGAYDHKKIFEATGSQRDVLLLTFVKDIAVWHSMSLCNAGTDLQLWQDRYERAVAWLRQMQKLDIKPNLPIINEDGDERPDTVGEYTYGSNPKRDQHF